MIIAINSLLHSRLRRIKERKKGKARKGEGDTENYDKMDISNQNIE